MVELPFLIGRQTGNQLVLRDTRISRTHARIIAEGGAHVIEDLHSLNGVFVNDERVQRRRLNPSDRIDFGLADSYKLVYTTGEQGLGQLAGRIAAPTREGGEMARLRAVVELARALESSLSTTDVLAALVDAALAITGAERGFLLLQTGGELEIRVARSREGRMLEKSELRVSRSAIRRALHHRRELLAMNFEPGAGAEAEPERSIADLELRSVVCIPLVRIRAGTTEATNLISAAADTVGVLYMDSRIGAADLTGGNRELLQSLAIEASTVLENARLLEEERAKQKIDEELNVARSIQQSLLPRKLPSEGWFRACGRSVASHQVGGDYFDVIPVNEDAWSAVVADVSGKGVSSALLASLLQGAFLTIHSAAAMETRIRRLNQFLNERTGGEKYATIFYCILERGGILHYLNAGHCSPMLVRRGGQTELLDTTGMPVGLLEDATFAIETRALERGDTLLIYTDGITEAQSPAGEFFGRKRLREIAAAHAAAGCAGMESGVLDAVAAFTESAPQSDDMTLVVVEFSAEP